MSSSSPVLTVFEVAERVLDDIEYHLHVFQPEDEKRCEGMYDAETYLHVDDREYRVYLKFGFCINSIHANPEWYEKFADVNQLMTTFRRAFDEEIKPDIETKSQMSEQQLKDAGINSRIHNIVIRINPEWKDPEPTSGKCIEAIGIIAISYEYFIPA
jgi:hypothetical protein